MTTVDLSTLTGLELLRLIQQREDLPPNIAGLLGMDFAEVEEGRVVMALTTGPAFTNVLGGVHGGIAATMLDSAMACAVHSTLPAGVGYTTLELKVNYTRPIAMGERITAVGTLVHGGRRTAVAEGRVTDAAGKLLAHGTTTCMIFR